MSFIFPHELFSIESTSGTHAGDLNNVLIWDDSNYWMSSSTENPYFTVKTHIPICVDQVDFMSRAYACVYPEKWIFEATKVDGTIITLLENKPGLCENNWFEDDKGKLCNSTTVSSYKINIKHKFKSFTFRSLLRSHWLPLTHLDISSIRFHGTLKYISSNGCHQLFFKYIKFLFVNIVNS